LSRRVAFAVAAMAAGQTAVYVARPVTSYRLLGLGHGATAVGLVAAAYALLPLVLAIPLGRRTDRRHGSRLLVAGCTLETAACAALSLVRSPVGLGAASALLGTGHLAVALGSQSVIAHESADERHDEHFALLTAGVSVGQLVGPLAGGLLLGHRTSVAATGHALLVATVVAAAAAVLAGMAQRNGGADPAVETAGAPTRVTEILRTRGVAAAIFTSVAALSATDIFTAYMPVLGEQRHIRPALVGVILALRAGASLVSRIGITRIVQRVGRERLIALNAVASAAALVGLTLVHDVALLAILAIVIGAGLGFAQPLSMTIVVQLVPVHVRASALAVRLTGNRLGQVAAPAAAGVVAGSAGASSVFWLTSGLLVASGLTVAKRPEPVPDEVERGDDDHGDRLADELARAE
jgi:MFS family permease